MVDIIDVKICGLVLAGGQSSRIGRDKASVQPFAAQNSTMLALAFHTLCQITTTCRVSCAKGKLRAGYPCIEDSLVNMGPAAGIAAGLEYCLQHGFSGLFALACDLPMMDAATLERLLIAHKHAPPGNLLTVFESPEGRLEMLAAIYDARALPIFHAALRKGKNALRRIIPEDRQYRVRYGGEDAKKFLNCNTKDDLRALL